MHLTPQIVQQKDKVIFCAGVQEKTKEWQQRFGQQLNLNVVELTGDTDLADFGNLNDADVICTTPEKLGGGPGLLHDLNGAGMSSWNQADMWGVCTDSITRRKVDQGGARFLGEVMTMHLRFIYAEDMYHAVCLYPGLLLITVIANCRWRSY